MNCMTKISNKALPNHLPKNLILGMILSLGARSLPLRGSFFGLSCRLLLASPAARSLLRMSGAEAGRRSKEEGEASISWSMLGIEHGETRGSLKDRNGREMNK